MPFILVDVPYLLSLLSTCSRTRETNSLSCIGPFHIGPATWFYLRLSVESTEYVQGKTHMERRTTFRAFVPYWRSCVRLEVMCRCTAFLMHSFNSFPERLVVKWLAVCTDVHGRVFACKENINLRLYFTIEIYLASLLTSRGELDTRMNRRT